MSSDVDLVADAVGELLDDRCGRDVVEAAERSGWAGELWDALAAGGYPWISVPEDAGGVGGGVAEACAVLGQVGRHAAPVPLAETGLLGGWLLARAGLPVPDGPVSTAAGSELVVRRDGGGPRLDGRVRRVPWARHAVRVVALADDPDGAGTAVVAFDPARADVGPGTNLAGEPRDDVRCDGVTVDPSDVAAAPDDVTAEALLRRGALSRAALIAGAAGRVLDITVAHTGAREQFGRPLARFQAVAGQLVRLAEQAEAAAMAARVAAANTENIPDLVDVAAAAAVTSEAAGQVAALAHQVTGAMGMTREYELGRLTRRLWSWRDEYGGERSWSTRLGTALAGAGADALWPSLSRGLVGSA